MQIAKVVGTVVATRKDARLDSRTLLVIQPMTPAGDHAGKTLVAADGVGAGVGEHVFYVRGAEASFPWAPDPVPTDASIVGIIDHWDVES